MANTKKENKKYCLTKEKIIVEENEKEKTLFRIKAIKDFKTVDGKIVHKGDLGGFVEFEKNLSQQGCCWVADNAKVYGRACVRQNAKVYDNAEISGCAYVCENSRVYNNSIISGNAIIYGSAKIHGNVYVDNNTEIEGNANIYGNAWIKDSSVVSSGKIYGHTKIGGHTQIRACDTICGNTIIYDSVIGGEKVKIKTQKNEYCTITGKTFIESNAIIDAKDTLTIDGAYIGSDAEIHSWFDYFCTRSSGLTIQNFTVYRGTKNKIMAHFHPWGTITAEVFEKKAKKYLKNRNLSIYDCTEYSALAYHYIAALKVAMGTIEAAKNFWQVSNEN